MAYRLCFHSIFSEVTLIICRTGLCANSDWQKYLKVSTQQYGVEYGVLRTKDLCRSSSDHFKRTSLNLWLRSLAGICGF